MSRLPPLDPHIVALAREREPAALAKVLDRLLVVAKRSAAKVVLRDFDRVDVDQEAEEIAYAFLLRVIEKDWKILDDHRPDLSPLDAFCAMQARGFALDVQKKKTKRRDKIGQTTSSSPETGGGVDDRDDEADPEEWATQRELGLAVLHRVLEGLDDKRRELFWDLMMEQRPIGEIQERHGLGDDAIYKARQRFREDIEAHWPQETAVGTRAKGGTKKRREVAP